MSKKQPWKSPDPIGSEISKFIHTMDRESDRGALLVGLAEIDHALGCLLSFLLSTTGAEGDADWLLDPQGGNRPLGTLAMRTRFARCLGQIDNESRGVIDAIRTIRNAQAHGTAIFKLTEEDIAPMMQAWSAKSRENVLLLASAPSSTGSINTPLDKLQASVGIITLGIRGQLLALRHSGIAVKAIEAITCKDKPDDFGI